MQPMSQMPQFIYLDTKIIGAAKQIVVFFNTQVFDKATTTVLIKKYRHRNIKHIQSILTKNNIQSTIVEDKDLDDLTGGFMFYPFNAQSNCRAVANRKLTHIFITHGESNKVSSVKPIIRIYDYVITAGQAGIDRYLANGIFSQHDVDVGRIIPLGNTFVGKTGLAPKGVGQAVIFYAPTWEGGIEQENYSSLSYTQWVAKSLVNTAKTHQTNTIVIKPHPNTGHRIKTYTNYIYELARQLKDEQLQVVVFKPYLKTTWIQSLRYKNIGITFVNSLADYYALVGFCDVSAVETQLLNEDIPYYLFLSKTTHRELFDIHHYQPSQIIDLSNINHHTISLMPLSYNMALKYTLINQDISAVALNQRINFLLNQIAH